jgi:hypothetical protein
MRTTLGVICFVIRVCDSSSFVSRLPYRARFLSTALIRRPFTTRPGGISVHAAHLIELPRVPGKGIAAILPIMNFPKSASHSHSSVDLATQEPRGTDEHAIKDASRDVPSPESSNSARSATQSAIFGILRRSPRNTRACAGLRSREGTGEAAIRTCSGRHPTRAP